MWRRGRWILQFERLKLDPGVSEKIKQTKRELIVHFPVEMDDGSIKIF
jgi:glutamate dehydrogenase (NAD(P)+)